MLQRPELADDERFSSNPQRVANRAALRTLILDAFSKLTAEEVVQRLDAAQISNARVNDMHAVWAHPQLQSRNCWTDVPSPVGLIPALRPPGRNTAYEPRMDAIPALGQHTESILQELGWAEDAIARLRSEGII